MNLRVPDQSAAENSKKKTANDPVAKLFLPQVLLSFASLLHLSSHFLYHLWQTLTSVPFTGAGPAG